eukprot:jgi/Ulvmu1/4081/UM019_0059.1
MPMPLLSPDKPANSILCVLCAKLSSHGMVFSTLLRITMRIINLKVCPLRSRHEGNPSPLVTSMSGTVRLHNCMRTISCGTLDIDFLMEKSLLRPFSSTCGAF